MTVYVADRTSEAASLANLRKLVAMATERFEGGQPREITLALDTARFLADCITASDLALHAFPFLEREARRFSLVPAFVPPAAAARAERDLLFALGSALPIQLVARDAELDWAIRRAGVEARSPGEQRRLSDTILAMVAERSRCARLDLRCFRYGPEAVAALTAPPSPYYEEYAHLRLPDSFRRKRGARSGLETEWTLAAVRHGQAQPFIDSPLAHSRALERFGLYIAPDKLTDIFSDAELSFEKPPPRRKDPLLRSIVAHEARQNAGLSDAQMVRSLQSRLGMRLPLTTLRTIRGTLHIPRSWYDGSGLEVDAQTRMAIVRQQLTPPFPTMAEIADALSSDKRRISATTVQAFLGEFVKLGEIALNPPRILVATPTTCSDTVTRLESLLSRVPSGPFAEQLTAAVEGYRRCLEESAAALREYPELRGRLDRFENPDRRLVTPEAAAAAGADLVAALDAAIHARQPGKAAAFIDERIACARWDLAHRRLSPELIRTAVRVGGGLFFVDADQHFRLRERAHGILSNVGDGADGSNAQRKALAVFADATDAALITRNRREKLQQLGLTVSEELLPDVPAASEIEPGSRVHAKRLVTIYGTRLRTWRPDALVAAVRRDHGIGVERRTALRILQDAQLNPGKHRGKVSVDPALASKIRQMQRSGFVRYANAIEIDSKIAGISRETYNAIAHAAASGEHAVPPATSILTATAAGVHVANRSSESETLAQIAALVRKVEAAYGNAPPREIQHALRTAVILNRAVARSERALLRFPMLETEARRFAIAPALLPPGAAAYAARELIAALEAALQDTASPQIMERSRHARQALQNFRYSPEALSALLQPPSPFIELDGQLALASLCRRERDDKAKLLDEQRLAATRHGAALPFLDPGQHSNALEKLGLYIRSDRLGTLFGEAGVIIDPAPAARKDPLLQALIAHLARERPELTYEQVAAVLARDLGIRISAETAGNIRSGLGIPRGPQRGLALDAAVPPAVVQRRITPPYPIREELAAGLRAAGFRVSTESAKRILRDSVAIGEIWEDPPRARIGTPATFFDAVERTGDLVRRLPPGPFAEQLQPEVGHFHRRLEQSAAVLRKYPGRGLRILDELVSPDGAASAAVDLIEALEAALNPGSDEATAAFITQRAACARWDLDHRRMPPELINSTLRFEPGLYLSDAGAHFRLDERAHGTISPKEPGTQMQQDALNAFTDAADVALMPWDRNITLRRLGLSAPVSMLPNDYAATTIEPASPAHVERLVTTYGTRLDGWSADALVYAIRMDHGIRIKATQASRLLTDKHLRPKSRAGGAPGVYGGVSISPRIAEHMRRLRQTGPVTYEDAIDADPEFARISRPTFNRLVATPQVRATEAPLRPS